eukprot:6012389-Heterocapsa_arctica.AAC.1
MTGEPASPSSVPASLLPFPMASRTAACRRPCCPWNRPACCRRLRASSCGPPPRPLWALL